MTCLSAGRIYAYLDGDLRPSERRQIKAHLAACPACRRAVEDRRVLAEASVSLRPLEVPADFAAAVMSRLPAPPFVETPVARPVRLAPRPSAVLAAVTALAAVSVTVALVADGGPAAFISSLSRFLWTSLRTTAHGLAKAGKVLLLLVRLGGDLLDDLAGAFRFLTSLIGPEAQMAVIGATLVLVLAGAALWGRKSILERPHEKL